ncbi:MAG: hypothetical protein Q4Q23_06790, partial [Methanobacteriaceae archaeon]|nr:hypothetical protein [Methanobacteriaceae archaeon]
NINGTVTDINDNKINNALINIYINNTLIDKVTTINGTYNTSYVFNSQGVYIIKVEINDTKQYNSINATNKINVSRITTNLIVNPVNINTTEKFNITGTLKDYYRNPITNAIINININNKTYTTLTNSKGIYNFQYMFDQTVNKTIIVSYNGNNTYNSTQKQIQANVTLIPTKIILEKITATIEETIQLTAIILDQNNNNINSGNIVFKLNGVTLKYSNGTPIKLQVRNGKATLNYTIPKNFSAKKYTITTIYSKTNKYDTSTTNSTLTVIKKGTITIVDDITAVKDTTTHFIARSYDINGNLIKNGLVEFKLNGKTLLSKISIINGKATYDYIIPTNFSAKNYTISAIYVGNSSYTQSRANGTLTILKGNVNITTSLVTTYAGQTINLTSKINTINGNNINSGTVIFKINGKTLKNSNGTTLKTTVINGTATLTYTIPKNYIAKNYTITAVFSDKNYNLCENNNTLIIKDNISNKMYNSKLITLKSTNNIIVNNYEELYNSIENIKTGNNQEYIINLNNGTYTITKPINWSNTTNTKTLTINGNNQTINGQYTKNFITIDNGFTLNINNIIITNTNKTAIAVLNGTLNIVNSTFINNTIEGLDPYDENGLNGGSIYNNGSVTIFNSKFIDNKAFWTENKTMTRGGVIYNEGNLLIDSSYFKNNTSNIGGAIFNLGNITFKYTLRNTQFINNKAIDYDPKTQGETCLGGAIYSIQSLVINHVNFINNNAGGSGGAIGIIGKEISGNYNVELKNSYFINNTADIEAGAVYLQNTRASLKNILFENNTALNNITGAGIGGAISGLRSKDINIVNCSFINNKAIANKIPNINNSSYGGAIIVTGHPLYIDNCIFTNNFAEFGGTIFSTILTIRNSIFLNNNATNGGVIANGYSVDFDDNLQYGSVDIKNTTFIKNTAKTGGAIETHGSNMNLVNIIFSDNTATSKGGAIYTTPDELNITKTTIQKSTFSNNKVISTNQDAYGGAIYVENSTMYLKNNIFKNNQVITNDNQTYGGAIYIFNNQNTSNKIINTQFTNNTLNYNNSNYNSNGGAIHITTTNDGTKSITEKIEITNSTFINNSARKDGGAIFSKIAETAITNSLFINNKAISFNTTQDSVGGAIKVSDLLKVKNSLFENNSAGTLGGAISLLLQKTTSNYIINTTFIKNTQTVYNENYNFGGGAVSIIRINGYAKIKLQNNIFINNSAGKKGGALYLFNNDAEIMNSDFMNNIASEGGAIFYRSGTIQSLNNTYTNNIAKNAGSTILTYFTEINIINSQFSNSKSNISIIELYFSKTELSNNIFKNNTLLTNNCGIITYESIIDFFNFTSYVAIIKNNVFTDNILNNNTLLYLNGVANNTKITIQENIFKNNINSEESPLIYINGDQNKTYEKIHINYNIITNTENTQIIATNNATTGIIDAKYNWWGSNNQNNTNTKSIDSSCPIIMTFNNNTQWTNQKMTFTLALNKYNQTGTIKTLTHTMPKITATITYQNTTITKTFTNFTQITPQETINKITATIDNQTITLKPQKQATVKILTQNMTVKTNDTIQLITMLMDTKTKQIIETGKIAIKINNKTIGHAYIKDGIGYYNYKMNHSPKTYNLTVIFSSDTYIRTEDTTQITVTKRVQT